MLGQDRDDHDLCRDRRASWLDRDGLQHRRNPAELHQPVLNAAAARRAQAIGYTTMQFFIHFPVVMLLAVALMHTFTYRAPVIP